MSSTEDQTNAGAAAAGENGAAGTAATTETQQGQANTAEAGKAEPVKTEDPQPATGAATPAAAASNASTAASSEGSVSAGVEKGDLFENEKDLLAAIAAKTGEKVTPAYIEGRIAKVAYAKIDETVTVCSLTLDNGFSVRGESACVDPANFDEKIGKSLAYKQAFDKLWPLFGFLLAESRHLRAQ